ncbi:polysaccharide deacetylase family protein [Enterococcus faecium]|uniref:polysaccharide deacetylase family protein n=1 Tax=Enterococcus faecium TaxID=1352 RepID=UPI0019DB81B7|nr:polysaccharide deacetylase family protein [Enterococcus faecium]EME8119993.1 polysaccharide deacetylase family protein [Enterococcus faecium]
MKKIYLFIGLIALAGVLSFEVTSIVKAMNARQEKSAAFAQTSEEKNTENSKTMDSISIANDDPSDEANKSVAISFDDGPSQSTTPQLLEILKSKGVHATFFVLGKNTEKYPQIVKQASEEGHEIGNHTYDHENLFYLPVESANDAIKKADNEIKKATGKQAKFIRPPYGSITSENALAINRPFIQWSVDSEDWKTRNSDLILKKVQDTVYDGSIILFHDIYPETINVIPRVIDYLKDEGYKFETVSELLDNPTTAENFYGKGDHRSVE